MNTADLPKRSLATFYQDAFAILAEADIAFLIGGAFAQSRYTSRDRDTKDLDIVLRRADVDRMLKAFGEADYQTEIAFPHWLAKIHSNGHYLDVMFGSGNGAVHIDDCWFAHAVEAQVLERSVWLCPPEELIWSKAFVQERERFADHWPVLFSHLVLFQFAYPDRRGDIPRHVLDELAERLRRLETDEGEHVCHGTILSREQYLFDVHTLGYEDARLQPRGGMSQREIEIWTDAIGK